MPASRRRRGSAAFLVGLPLGASFCSGANFMTCSAIALLLTRLFRSAVLDGVTHVFFHCFELGEEAMGVRRIDALERVRGELGFQPAHLAEQGAAGLLQIEAVDAAIAGVA